MSLILRCSRAVPSGTAYRRDLKKWRRRKARRIPSDQKPLLAKMREGYA